MRSFLILAIAALLSASITGPSVAQQAPAFPGAEGFGADARGGRGGRVLHVTNLADGGPGSLRWAIEQQGPRTIVFDVSGVVKLNRDLTIRNPFVTIAGQTAPGDGICLRDAPLEIAADEVIVRYIRCRLGDQGRGGDAISISKGKNIVVDHCSASWSTDEALSASTYSPTLTNVTVQWCFITEALNPAGHGFGSLIRGTGGAKYSFLHNLYAHNRGRNPRPGNYDSNPHDEDPEGLLLDFRNNVIYNWEGAHAGYNADHVSVTRLNYVGNSLIPGPNSEPTGIAYATGSPYDRAFFSGNLYDDRRPDDPWDMVKYHRDWTDGEIRAYKQSQAFESGPVTEEEDARTAFERVMRIGGASLPKRDAVDVRIVRDVRRRAGRIINSQDDVGGWPALDSAPAPADTDQDGMPDAWERKYGLDPSDASDGARDGDGDGYTNLEERLNGSDPTAHSDYEVPRINKDGAARRAPESSTSKDGSLGDRYRVIVSTDIGGTDPDDFQSMVHFLVYADQFDIEGLVSSPYGPGRASDILEVIDCYEHDYANLRTYSDRYPSPTALRALVKQGETEVAPYAGVRRSTEGSDWIVKRARRNDPRPLYVLVWGGLEDLAQALHDAPDILPKLRVYWIGGPNKKWSPDAFQYIATDHPQLWMIECNSTYRGWFTGGDQAGPWGNQQFVRRHVAGHGALGEFFDTQLQGTIKMGDTPSVGLLLSGAAESPSRPGWGGRFVRAWERPYVLLDRMPTTDERMEVFGILELALPLGDAAPETTAARLDVENQSLVGHAPGDGSMRFRFCPKAAKTYRFTIQSNAPALAGKTGGITALAPSPDVAQRPSSRLPNWWTDNPADVFAEGEHLGAKTVSRWRCDFLRDFAGKMDRCQTPKSLNE